MKIMCCVCLILMWYALIGTSTAISEDVGVGRKQLLILSESLAYEHGKAYEMDLSCGKDMDSVSPRGSGGFFLNYIAKSEIGGVQQQYEKGQKSQKGLRCDQDETIAYMNALQTKVANYIRIATPFTLPYSK